MGIKFACAECGYVLHVKSALAGKRGFCPKCQSKVDIPAEGPPTPGQIAGAVAYDTPESVNMAVEPQVIAAAVAPASPTGPRLSKAVPVAAVSEPAADPIAENPEMQWYVVPPGPAAPYGPAAGKLFRAWIDEGRVTADSLVWRQDWKDWQPASSVLPQFRTPPMPQGLPPLTGAAMQLGATTIADLAPDLVSPIAGADAAAAPEPVDEQIAALTKTRRAAKKPRDLTNILIIVLAIGVLVMVPMMFYMLK